MGNYGKENMSRFRGTFEYSIDSKGRLNIPAKFRKLLRPEADETFVISRAPDGCLQAYPQDAWEEYEDMFESTPLTKEKNRARRLVDKTISDSRLDKQGRITLTPLQMEITGIKKSVTIIGRRKFIEVWDTATFDKYTENDSDFDEIFYKAVGGGE